jgi:flagellar biosynthesis protein FliP
MNPSAFALLTGPIKGTEMSAAMEIMILLTVLSLGPLVLVTLTSFTRIVIVLSFLRQAMGTQQSPSNQIIIALSLFISFHVMAPVWILITHLYSRVLRARHIWEHVFNCAIPYSNSRFHFFGSGRTTIGKTVVPINPQACR